MAAARTHAPEPPPACRPAPDRLRMPRHPPGTPSSAPLPPCSLPLTPLLFSPHGRSRHGHSDELHHGHIHPPRSLSACLSSALTPSSYPPTHAIRGGRKRLERRRLYLWCPEIAAVNSPAQKPPRARRASLPTPCELLHLPLCSPPLCFSPLARFRRSRELIAAGHDASVVLATTARA